MAEIKFKINGKTHTAGGEISSDLSLVEYIRNLAELRGTKYMCREGGCGACIVSVVKTSGGTPEAVNSCLVSVPSCDGWEITTIEKVGNRKDGYSDIQTTLAEENGTQCGYCSPGWVMSMHSLKESKKDLTMLEIEKSFGSNICRCTGYRPILEAFKKFAVDYPEKNLDIEDLKICQKTGRKCCKKNSCSDDSWCMIDKDDAKLNASKEIVLADDKKWYKVNTVNEIADILIKEGDESYMLVAGNTAKGVYPIDEYPRVLIDISGVTELKGQTMDQNLIVGAGNTLTDTLAIFLQRSKEENFSYLEKLYEHINLVAHIAVRNIGTIAGNLMIKNQHNVFPSDLFLLFETVQAQLTIQNLKKTKQTVTMQQFLKLNMRGQVILNVLFPPLSLEYKLVTMKIMPRAQSAHAIVNAGFLYKLNDQNVVQEARIVYGGLSPSYVRSSATEAYLIGKKLFSNDTLTNALSTLKEELVVTESPPDASAELRKQLALNLFFKGLLSLCPPEKVDSRFRSGVTRIKESRPVSNGRQVFDTNPTLWPLNQPVQKLEALIQCAGEAPYSEDLPSFPREVFAAFVLSTVASGTIVSIDPSKATSRPGVITFYTAKDIPGVNSFTPSGTMYSPNFEELLAEDTVKYYNQPIGIIVAETRAIADRVAKLVDVKYENVKNPIVDVKEARKDAKRNSPVFESSATERGGDVAKVINSEYTVYSQFHFSMETLVCVTKPTEEGLELHSATQWMDGVHEMAARVCNLDLNRVDVHVRRLGGAYGNKVTRGSQVAVASALVSKKLNRPCRFILPLTTNMRAVGKRFPFTREIEVQVNQKGEIQYINCNSFSDNGFMINEPLSSIGTDSYYNCYRKSRWDYKLYDTITDTPSNSWCRSPSTLETIGMAEILMEQIAYEMSLDPLEVRLTNLDNEQYGDIKTMVEELRTTAKYQERRTAVDKFNKENRWKKRGLRWSFSRWTAQGTQYFDITLSVYHADGTVAITHGGVEMGQGINTKAAQIAAYLLNIPLEKVQIKANNTMIAPNSFVSGGSLTSQNVGVGVQRACEQLLARLEPVRNQVDTADWNTLINKAFELGIDLQAHGFVNLTTTQTYNIFGVALAEVEIDVLTGEFEIIRVDILQDVGRSISPEMDVGQIEGAFVMGIGYWTLEELVYNKDTGELLTDRTWNYHVPQARDIPQDFRIYFRKNSFSSDEFPGAKAAGEPPMCLSVVVAHAIREALAQARLETGIPTNQWFNIDGPYTLEKICLSAGTKIEEFKFN